MRCVFQLELLHLDGRNYCLIENVKLKSQTVVKTAIHSSKALQLFNFGISII
jgi:hypothetical protein